MWKKNEIIVKNEKAKNGPILKIQVAICNKINFFIGGSICKELSKFGYFNKLLLILNRVKKVQNLNICDGKLIKNEMLIRHNN